MHIHMGKKEAAPHVRKERSPGRRASMHWPQHAAYPDVVDRVTARTSTGLLASLLKQFLSNFTREWTRSGRAVAGPKGIHALVPPCFTCLCGRFCDCAHDQQAAEDSLKQFLQGHSIDMRSYVMYTWVERMRYHRIGRGDLRTKGHPCTGPNMLHTPTW